MTDETPKLARCPFGRCGGKADINGDGEGWYTAYCVDCGVQSPPHYGIDAAASWWNDRTPEWQVPELPYAGGLEVEDNPGPRAHKSIGDYQGQLRAKKKRKRPLR